MEETHTGGATSSAATDYGQCLGFVRTPAKISELLLWPDLAGLPDPLRLLDPACGTGDLLLGAAAAAVRRGLRSRIRLLGLELDPARAACARRSLEAGARALEGDLGRGIEVEVACRDALDPALPWPAGAWIVANPPWISFSGRQSGRGGAAAASLRARFLSMGGWPSLHGAFLERCARHVAEEGTGAALLLPASICSQDRYEAARAAALAWAELDGDPLWIGEGAFPGVVGAAAMVRLRPRSAPPETPRPTAGAWNRLVPDAGELGSLLGRYPRLPERCFADPGVHTGNAGRWLVRRERDGLPPGAAPDLREGRDLAAYALGPPRACLLAPDPAAIGLRFRIPPLERCRTFPILLRQTADRPIAALHSDPGRFRNSLLACRPPPELDPAFAVAILNGPLARCWHRGRFADARQRAFPQVKVGHLRTQPFPIVARDQDPGLHDELAARVRDLRPGAAEFGARVAALERRALEAFGLDRERAAALIAPGSEQPAESPLRGAGALAESV